MAGAQIGSQTMQMKAQPQKGRRPRKTEEKMLQSSNEDHHQTRDNTVRFPPPTTSSSSQYLITETGAWADQLALEAAISKGGQPLAEPNSNWRSGDEKSRQNSRLGGQSLGQATQNHRASSTWMNNKGNNNSRQQHCYQKDVDVVNLNSGANLRNIIARTEGQESREGLHTISNRNRNRRHGNHRVSRSAEQMTSSNLLSSPSYKQQPHHGNDDNDGDDDDRGRQHEIIHQGSLFVGSGLGLRKEQDKKKSMSSREMLKSILANRVTTSGSVEGSM